METDHPSGASDERETSIFDTLPRYGAGKEVIHLFRCGGCHVDSPYVRSYELITIIFGLVFLIWRSDTVMKCPRCMRYHVLARLPLALLLANVLSPVVLAWWSVVFVKTFFSRPF